MDERETLSTLCFLLSPAAWSTWMSMLYACTSQFELITVWKTDLIWPFDIIHPLLLPRYCLYLHTKTTNLILKYGTYPPCSCSSLLIPLPIALFQPLSHIPQIIKKWPLSTQVGNLSLLNYTHTFIGHTICYISIVVHAVSHQLALWWQWKVLNEFLCSPEPLLHVLVFPDIERARTHGGCHPAIGWVSFVNVHQQKISHITELLHQPAESWQVADEGGSGGWAKVDHQGAIWRLKIQKPTFVSSWGPGTGGQVAHVTDTATPPWTCRHLHQFGVGCLTTKFDLRRLNKDFN